mmetsp:Transcript_89548/g.252336  ORF Transcript_89548/g.252336 Transcript_89548/m.252336 type:complete len:168 (+) Transcript_89548:222-725(+)
MDEFKDSKTSLVADVDCTTDGKDLCEKHGVKGYPTIKYGDPNDLQDYSGGRDYAALKTFADENLGPTCGPDNLDLCDEESKTLIAKFQKMDADELDMAIEEGDAKIKKIEAASQKKVDGLRKKIQDLQGKIEAENKNKDDAVAKETKKLGLRFKRAVAAAKKKKEEL